MSKRTAYVDADMLIYKACFVAEKIDVMTGDYPEATDVYDGLLQHVLDETDVDDYFSVISDDACFRKQIWPEYKANRKDSRKPDGLAELKRWVDEERQGLIIETLEADDVIGVFCTRDTNNVACSGDKDFRTLPLTWFNFLKCEWETQTLEQADYNHLIQTLTGDPTDGYHGIPGIGPKKAEKILREGGPTWKTIVDAYEQRDLTHHDAYRNASMAYILRSHNLDLDAGELLYWAPGHVSAISLDRIEAD